MAFVLVILALATVVVVVVIRQVFSLAQTRMSSSAEESYRSLAEEAVAAQARAAEELESISATLADLQTRVSSMERMMREVD
jgi:hypothetical protein